MSSRACALLVLLGCGGAPCPPSATPATVTALEPAPAEPDRLADAVTNALAEGRRADATVLLRALADREPDRALALGLSSLAVEPLPTVAPLGERRFERSVDGRIVAHRFVDPTSGACDEIVVERFDLERGEHTVVSVAQGTREERLGPLLPLDAAYVEVATDTRRCGAAAPLLPGDEPPGTVYSFSAGAAVSFLAPSSETCGQLELLSPRGRWAIVTSLVVTPGTGACVGRRVVLPDRTRVCLGPSAHLFDLEGGATRPLGPIVRALVSPDDRWLLVSDAAGDRVEAADGSVPPRALGADCGGPAAFSLDATAVAVSCGSRIDVLDLATGDAHSIALEDGAHVRGVGVDSHGDRVVVVGYPAGGATFSIADATGTLTHSVGSAEIAASERRASADPSLPTVAAPGPRLRPSVGVRRRERAWAGGYLAAPPIAAGYFVGGALFVVDEDPDGASEVWVPATLGGRHPRASWALERTIEGWPGELVGAEDDPTLGSIVRFTRTVLGIDGRVVAPAPADHALGPSRWSTPLEPDVEGDVGALVRATGGRTNLRPCRDDLRVVPVFPRPGDESIWAPEDACAPREEGPERDPESIECVASI